MQNHFTPKRILFFALLILIATSSCRRVGKQNHWDVDLIAPLLTGSLSINNIVADSLIHTNADKSISLVYATNLYSLNLADQVLHIPDTTFANPLSVGRVGLGSKQINFNYSLGKMSALMPFPYNLLIQSSNGTSQIIPALYNITAPYSDIDASNVFQVAYVKTGFIDIQGDNQLPIAMDSVKFVIRNKNPPSAIIGSKMFLHIPAHSHFSDTIDISGKKIEGVLQLSLLHMSTPGSGGVAVPIDTSKGLRMTFTLYHVTCDSAIARFPAQALVDTGQIVTYQYVTGGASIDYVKIKSGDIRVKVFSSLHEPINFTFKMPPARSPSGVAVNMTATTPPAPYGGYSSLERTVDLSGYTLDFTGPHHNMHNTFYDTVKISIDSTLAGKLDTLRANDSLYMFYTLENIIPEYAHGYLGDTTLNLSVSNVPFTALKKIMGGSFNPEKIKVDFTVENGIGVDGQIKINSLSATNSKTGTTQSLTAPVIGNNVNILRATDHPLTAGITTQTINETNSNIKSLITMLPDKLSMAAQVKINPSGNALFYQDFVYFNSTLKVNMRTEFPLSFIATGLQIKDSLDFSLGSPAKIEQIKDGTLTIHLENGFPLAATITMDLYDENWTKLDQLLANTTIASGGLDGNCKVNNPASTKIDITFDQSRMSNIKKAKHAVVNAVLNTSAQTTCNGQYLKIYDSYELKTNITAKFNYQVNAF